MTTMTPRLAAITCLAVTVGSMLSVPVATAAERQFLVILAHSPKQYGLELPPGGLPDVEAIRKHYSDLDDPSIGSFAEYWDEISFGDVTVSSKTEGWLNLPWSIQPSATSGVGNVDATQFYDLNENDLYDYGAGEEVSHLQAVIIDTDGDPNGADNGPFSPFPASGHRTDRGDLVWKPGERFIDMDNDGKWDGADEGNNEMDNDGDGQPDLPGPWIDLNEDGAAGPGSGSGCTFLPDSDNDGNPDCCPNGPGDTGALGQAGYQGCGRYNIEVPVDDYIANPLLVCPPLMWEGPNNVQVVDCNGNMIPDACDIDPNDNPDAALECEALGWTGPFPQSRSRDQNPSDGQNDPNPDNIPDECQFQKGFGAVNFCIEDAPGFECLLLGQQRMDLAQVRCEFFDRELDGISLVEPFENFMRRWDPCMQDPDAAPQNLDEDDTRTHWIKVYDPSSDAVATCDDPPRTFRYDDPSYIFDNYPARDADVLDLIQEAGERWIFGSHDPDFLLRAMDCRCADGCLCGPLGDDCIVALYNLDRDLDLPTNVDNYCVVGTHVGYDPPDGWINAIADNGPDGEEYTTKMKQAPAKIGIGQYERDLRTWPPPDWFPQAWEDRYRHDDGTPREVPDWIPLSSEVTNIPRMQPFADADPGEYDAVEHRRFFKANAGGANGDGTGWIGCDDRLDGAVVFETGDAVPSFENLCDRPILPDEAEGPSRAGIYYDGWVEHDDLPSSKYHRGGDERLGEVTSPYTEAIFGHDRSAHSLNGLPFPDNVIPAAGPYATNIHGNYGFDAGNLLNMEWLTWRTSPPFNDGVAWEEGAYFDPTAVPLRFHPYAGPQRGVNKGFRDYNLDGLIDQGETRFPGSENYLDDPHTHTTERIPGTESAYPFNRRRLLEDCIEALDVVFDFDNWVDDVSMAATGTPATRIPEPVQGLGSPSVIQPDGVNSGIVLLPAESHVQFDFLRGPSFYAIHNEDGGSASTSFPATGTQKINWNLFFHDLVISTADARSAAGDWQTGYSSHEYLHAWEQFPDLYDYDIYNPFPSVISTPVGRWDIMAGSSEAATGQVHSVPVLKEQPGTDWIKPVDLASVLTPGIEATITLPPYETTRDNNAYFLENEAREGERFYFYSVGRGFDVPGFPGFGVPGRVTGGYPGTGMLILHTDVGPAGADSLPSLFAGTRAAYQIVQADGLGQLQDGVAPHGDEGDPWPGSTGATRFNFYTTPAAVWHQTRAWTGLDVLDVVPDGNGAVQLKLIWVPTSIPSLRFVNPPGGTSVGGRYTINVDATDVYGGTTIDLYRTQDPDNVSISGSNRIGTIVKNRPATRRLSLDWNVDALSDGRYHVFAKLTPGPGADGSERSYSVPRAGRNNKGTGALTVDNVDIAGNTARSETWTLRLVDIRPDGTQDWLINAGLSQPEPADDDPNDDPYPHLLLNPTVSRTATYSAPGGQVEFTLRQCYCDGSDPTSCPAVNDDACSPTPMAQIGDSWSFTTTGITAASRAISILDGEVNEDPRANIFATPLTGLPPLAVFFDARDSVDPNGQALEYRWDFGDGSAAATGTVVQHTYTQSGTFTAHLIATNPDNGRFGEAAVDIDVTNNSPNAKIIANPTSGGERLEVAFSAAQSSDQESSINNLTFQWEFGDGETANSSGLPGILVETNHFYIRHPGGGLCTADTPCVFLAKLTVTDEGGKQDIDTVEIRVGNTNPLPVITHSALQGDDPHEVTFDASNSLDAEGHAMSIRWDWGDGTNDTFADLTGTNGDGDVTHEFTRRAGEAVSTFHVTAVITDEKGGQAEWPGAIVVVSDRGVLSSNPVAAFTIDPDPPVLNEPVTGDASASFDRPNGDAPARISWDWGDGTVEEGATPTHTYTEPGQYTIRVAVYDGETPPNIGVKLKNVRVALGDDGIDPSENRKPNAKIKVNATEGTAGITEFIFDASGSTDPDEDQLTYEWNFGDRREAGAVVARVFSEPGNYSVTLKATDPDNASDSTIVTITVMSVDDNTAPYAFIGTGMRTGSAPLTLTFNGLGSYDPDGDPITFRWEFVHNGVLLADADASVVTQTFEDAGVYQVVLEVSDARGGITRTEPETVTVTARVNGGDGTDGTDGGSGGSPIRDSSLQRPSGFCGVGMITSFFGSLIGLSFIRLTRRRFLG